MTTGENPHLEAVLQRIDADLDASLERLFELLRIPSISTDPAYAPECRRAAEWLAADLTGLGFEARLVETPEAPGGQPMVVAHLSRAAGAPPAPMRALFYGHYDVQPVDPLALWDHEPFAPQLEERSPGRKIIRARGAADDKGQLMTFLEAVRAWIAVAGAPPIDVSVLFEGEEECGSPSLAPFFARHGAELKSDLALICDTSMWNAETPAITTSLRGMATEEVTIRCASRDLHSGYYGSAARNPIALLAEILSSLRDAAGRVTLPGFYDGVPEPTEAQRANWAGLGFDEASFLGEIGLSVPAGEADRSVLEQVSTRPTFEINGISGGYTGEGFKTVIPAEASAKVSFRLVGAQDPDKVRAAFRAYVEARLPKDCSAEFHAHGGGRPVALPADSAALKAAAAALRAEWGRDPALVGGGGSIPIAGAFKNELGMEPILVGFGLDDDQIHSPNEKYELKSFHKGARSWARILAALAAAE